MKTLVLCMLVSSVCLIEGIQRRDLEKYGPFHLLLNSNVFKCEHDRTLNLDVSDINVHFYDFSEDVELPFTIDEAADGILAAPTLVKVKKFFIYIGGFKSNINKKVEDRVRNAFRNFPNSHLIIFDHSAYTHNRDGNKKGYERSVSYVHYIGKRIAETLAVLSNGQISPKNMHGIGHSLGAQILGHVGEHFLNLTGTKMSRITALDPAGPCFTKSFIQEQVRSGVADYVEVYHCDKGGLGTSSVLGDVDFFVNKGVSQPHCSTSLMPGVFMTPKAASCSHRTCVDVWLASVAHPDWYPAFKCERHKDFKNGKCSSNDKTIAGFWNPGDATGVYYFSTKDYDIDEIRN